MHTYIKLSEDGRIASYTMSPKPVVGDELVVVEGRDSMEGLAYDPQRGEFYPVLRDETGVDVMENGKAKEDLSQRRPKHVFLRKPTELPQ